MALPLSAGDVGESVSFSGRPAVRSEQWRPSGAGHVLFDTKDSDPPGAPYDTVLMHGFMPDANVRLEVAVPALGGLWHEWKPAEVRRFADGRFWARYKFGPANRRPLRLRAVDSGIQAAHVFDLYDAELFIAGTGPDLETASAPSRNGRARVSSGAYVFVPRADWGAQPPKEAYSEHAPDRFTMHHTAGRQPKTYDEALKEVQFIQDFHMNGRGWIDIGYHFLISPTGQVFQGRPEHVRGAHVLNHNTGNLGVSLMGNYHPPVSHEPTDGELKAFVALGKRLVADYKMPIENIKAHRDLQSTDCPGDILYAALPELKEQISGRPPKLRVGIPKFQKRDFPVDAYLKRLPW